MQILPIESFPQDVQSDIELAEKTLEHSFPPNRATRVATVLRADNKVYTASNIRRRAFNSSTCAERMAIDKALFDECKHLERFVIVGYSTADVWDDFTNSPCGLCRQIMQETVDILGQSNDLEILIVNQSRTKVMQTSLKELLPLAFVRPASTDTPG